mgnify:CR=1 FL=1
MPARLYSIYIRTITNNGRPRTYNAPERAGATFIPELSAFQRNLFYHAERQRAYSLRPKARSGKPFYRSNIFPGKSGLYPHNRGKAIRNEDRRPKAMGLLMAATESHHDSYFVRSCSRGIGQADRGFAADISPILFLQLFQRNRPGRR